MRFGNVVLSVAVSAVFVCSSVYACDYDPGYYVEEYYYDDYDDCGSYGGGGTSMSHWANLRDECGNIIGQVGAGSSVEVIGVCEDDPSRSLVYDYNTGTYGTVSSVYIYGGSAYEYENPTEYSYSTYGNTGYENNCYENTEYSTSQNNSYQYSYSEQSSTSYNYEYSETYGRSYGSDGYCYEGDNLYIYDGYVPDGQDNITSAEWDESCYGSNYDSTYDYCNVAGTWDENEGRSATYGSNEIWVDVNISAQTVNIYQGNTIICSGACVTGMSGVSDTPCGTFYIGDKERNAVLCGEDYDGSSYECPVDYWMQFSGGCGFHDASWRENFGGDIYEYGGSHGCVNLEHDFAQEMYEIVPDGAQVVVHGNG